MTLRSFRVGVVGARRARRGVGEHLARFLHAAGAKVVAVTGTTRETSAAAAAALAPVGIAATAFTDAAEMVAASSLDALVVASPPETHDALLRLGLAAGLHVLCEKPLLPPDAGSVAAGRALLAEFAARGLLVAENTPWRHALGAYMQLFPDVTPRAARAFEMELSPSVTGLEMIPDALPHPLAVLGHLVGGEDAIRDVRVTFAGERRATVELALERPAGGRIAATVRLSTCEAQPRPAAIGFDGRLARREIEEPGYRASLLDAAAPSRRVALPDPMEALVRRFVERVRKSGAFPVDPVSWSGLARLREVVDAAARVAPALSGG